MKAPTVGPYATFAKFIEQHGMLAVGSDDSSKASSVVVTGELTKSEPPTMEITIPYDPN